MKIMAYAVREDEKPYILQLAEKHGIEIGICPDIPDLNNAYLADGCIGVSILGYGKINKELLDIYKSMGIRCLTTRAIGYNHIDVEYAKSIGISVCNARYEPNGVAEYSVMLMLLCMRKFKAALYRNQINDYTIPGLMGKEMKDLTVGILGTGRIGYQVAKILSGFGCKVIAYDPFQRKDPEYVTYTDLDTLIRESDIISLHLNLNESTKHIINQDTIAKMKKGVILVNCARGGLMDTDALIHGIETGQIGSIGLDTIDCEEGIFHFDHRNHILANPPMAYLRQFPNVVLTQHIAFYTDAAVSSMVQCGIEGILSVIETGTYPTIL